MITRRDTARLILAGAATAMLPAPGLAASKDAWINALQDALANATPQGCGTRLTLTQFGFRKRGRTAAMSAIVRMDWPAGLRTRRFDASEPGENEAFNRLYRDIVREFGSANPRCFA